MSNLLNDAEGRNVVIIAQRHLLERRISRFFKRNLVIDYEQFSVGSSEFDLGTLLGQLNLAWDDELRDLYRLLGTIGGLPESIADTTIHVNPSTGSDPSGTGSAARPYASLWFVHLLPKRINHNYRILIYNNLNHTGVLTITNEFGAEGCLSFIGVGQEVEVYGAVAGNVVNNQSHQLTWREITGSINPVSGCTKSFLQLTSGTHDNHAVPVNRIDTSNAYIWTRNHPIQSVSNGDSYRFIEPPVSISFTGLEINCVGSEYIGLSPVDRGARVVFCNLQLHFGETEFDQMMTTKGVAVAFGFCQIGVHAWSGNDWPIRFKNIVNRLRPVDTSVETLSQSNVANIFPSSINQNAGLMFINDEAEADEFDPNDNILSIEEFGKVYTTDCMAEVQIEHANARINYFSCKRLQAYSSNIKAVYVAIDPNDTGDLALTLYDTILHSNNILFGVCSNAAYLYSSRWRFQTGGGDAGTGSGLTNIPGDGIWMQGISFVYLNTAWTGTQPTTAAIDFKDTNPDTASAWPAQNAQVTDALTNVVMRGDT